MFGIIFGWKMFREKDRDSKREREFEVFSENENKRNYNGKLWEIIRNKIIIINKISLFLILYNYIEMITEFDKINL